VNKSFILNFSLSQSDENLMARWMATALEQSERSDKAWEKDHGFSSKARSLIVKRPGASQTKTVESEQIAV
jgi:hypothetical protein